MASKSYKLTQFSSVEFVGKDQFIVWNDVAGLPIYADPDADFPQAKTFSWNEARIAAEEIGNHYKSISSR